MKKILLGNEAFARGAYEAGVRVVASYPGTPSTEVTENAAKYDEMYVEWAPNEKVALEVAVGASVGGARALSCMKHVGLNVAADPLFTASYTGVNGGLVVLVADDPGMHSSQNEQDSRFYARSAHLPMLEPSDSKEAKEFMAFAYDLSEKYDTPVLMRSNTRVSHSRGVVDLGERTEVPLKEYKKDIQKYVMMPGMAKGRHIVVERRMKKLAEDANVFPVNRVEMADTKIGVITSGTCYNYVKEALPNASVLKLGMVYPLPMDVVREFASQVETLYVVEELEPFFENQLKANGISVIGKEIFTVQGEYSTNMIRQKIGGEQIEYLKEENVPGRPPVLCPGCPHRAVFYTLHKLGLTVCGDIGCYTLGSLPPLGAIDTCLCMGGSISMSIGMEKARGQEFAQNMVSIIGDSTFLHSGITGLIDMVYNKATGTVIIVDNSTTGMTGHQDHAMTGKDAKGNPAPQICLEELLHAVGVKNVVVVDPFELDEFQRVVKEETARREVSVIVARRPCMLLSPQYVKPSLVIDPDKCKNCKACMQLGCPAIQKLETRVDIDSSLCTGCGLCTSVCKFGAIKGAN